jgi:hypothetical protein
MRYGEGGGLAAGEWARTWGKRGRTPVVSVTCKGAHRVSLAALLAVKG